MRYSNLHTHTTFSDGLHSVEENIRAAAEKNMLCLGISDHSYTPFDLTYCMRRERYGAYQETLSQVKLKSPIPVYAGLELDAFSEDDPSFYDYIIASVHYLRVGGNYHSVDHSPDTHWTCVREAFGGSVTDMARAYFDTLGEHVARVKPTLVGHFDLPTKFSLIPEAEESYRRVAEDAMKDIIKLCPYIEMNTGAMARGLRTVPYPAPYLLKTIRENGGRIVLSSDSHHKDRLTFGFEEAVRLLKENRIESVYVFNGAGFDPMPLE